MLKLRIDGTGRYLPELVVTNQMMSTIVDTNDEWITTRTGISERRLSSGEPTWYMAAEAARKALAASGLSAGQIDLIIVSTVTPDYFTPSVASIVQAEIGASHAFCYDLNAACSGFVFALDQAARYLNTPDINHVLVVSAETLSKLTDFSDRSTCVLFGDGAGAVICSRGQEQDGSMLLASFLATEGQGGPFIFSHALQVNHPFMPDKPAWPDRFDSAADDCFIHMNGHEVYKFAVRALTDSILKAADRANLELSDLRYIIPHQANARIVDAAARRMKVKKEQVIYRMENFGNTSSASIPICLDELIEAGKLERGDKVAISGFGGGLTYGAAIFSY